MPIAFFMGRTPHFSSSLPARCLGWGAFVLAAAPTVTLEFNGVLLQELNVRLGYSRLLAGGVCRLGLLSWSRWRMSTAARDEVAEVRAHSVRLIWPRSSVTGSTIVSQAMV